MCFVHFALRFSGDNVLYVQSSSASQNEIESEEKLVKCHFVDAHSLADDKRALEIDKIRNVD